MRRMALAGRWLGRAVVKGDEARAPSYTRPELGDNKTCAMPGRLLTKSDQRRRVRHGPEHIGERGLERGVGLDHGDVTAKVGEAGDAVEGDAAGDDAGEVRQ